MALPKKNKFNPNIPKIGDERTDELIDMITDKSNYLPKHIGLEDLDGSVYEFTQKELNIIVEGKSVPIMFMTTEKWAELEKTWDSTDEEGNITMPYILVRRIGAPKPGTNTSLKYRIAQNKKFTYSKVPVYENGILGFDYYKTPQPTPIDLEFEVRFFSHMMVDLNSFSERLQHLFASGQAYILSKGYYMPLMLENVDDVSTMDEFDGHRFYSLSATLNLVGFIQDSSKFEKVQGNRDLKMKIK